MKGSTKIKDLSIEQLCTMLGKNIVEVSHPIQGNYLVIDGVAFGHTNFTHNFLRNEIDSRGVIIRTFLGLPHVGIIAMWDEIGWSWCISHRNFGKNYASGGTWYANGIRYQTLFDALKARTLKTPIDYSKEYAHAENSEKIIDLVCAEIIEPLGKLL